jgi:hypothetical protein
MRLSKRKQDISPAVSLKASRLRKAHGSSLVGDDERAATSEQPHASACSLRRMELYCSYELGA